MRTRIFGIHFSTGTSDKEAVGNLIVDGTPNEDPVALDDFAGTIVEDPPSPLVISGAFLLSNDTDPDGDDLEIISFSQPVNGTLVDNLDGTYSYTPNPDHTGPETFNYTVDDAKGSTNSAQVTIVVTPPINDAPVIRLPATLSGDEDTVIALTGMNVDDVDVDEIVEVGTPPNTLTVNITLGAGANGSLSLADTTGLTFSLGDGSADTEMEFTGAPANVNAALASLTYAGDTDFNGSETLLIVASVTQGANGSVVTDGTTVTYTPSAGFSGTDTFSYTVSDGNGGTATANVGVTVDDIPDDKDKDKDKDKKKKGGKKSKGKGKDKDKD